MKNIRLVQPSLEYAPQLHAFKKDFSDGIHGGSNIEDFDDIKDWLNFLHLHKNLNTLLEGRVPSRTYLAINHQDQLVGMTDLRLELNDYLFSYGGHIGYSVAPNAQGKGYGTEMLTQVIKKAKAFNLDRVLVVCQADNLKSEKVILKNKGYLEDERIIPETREKVKRFWIKVS